MKPLSAGVLITDGEVFLACRPTGHEKYNLPKGMQEEGESPLETCCRETREETGILLNPGELNDLGRFPYLKNKDLHLYMWHTKALPETKKLVCTSYFRHYWTKKMEPEVDDFRYFRFRETNDRIHKSMAEIINRIAEERFPEAMRKLRS